MAAINVTGAGANGTITYGARVAVRTSSGIPYVVVDTGNDIDVYKGNGTTPTSFSSNGTGPSSSGYGAHSAAIDSSDIIHIAYINVNAKSSDLRYVTYDTGTDTFSGDVEIVGDLGGDFGDITAPGTAIAIDSNDIPHIAYVSYYGKGAGDISYANKVGGSWNTDVEVEGATNDKQCLYPDIAIDADNLPVISYFNVTDGDIAAAQGNTNNATSFTIEDVDANGNSNGPGIAVDSSGNIYIGYHDVGDSQLHAFKFSRGGFWGAAVDWTELDSGIACPAGNNISVVADGADIYFFFEDSGNDIHCVSYKSSSWTDEGDLETGTFNSPKAKWAFWVDNDSGGDTQEHVGYITYHFDASDNTTPGTPDDPGSVFTNESNAVDDDEDTGATTTTTGSASSNYLDIQGTDAPASFSGATIDSVDYRIVLRHDISGTDTELNIYTDGLGETLANIDYNSPAIGVSTKTGTLTEPSGGWTWAKIQALEIRFWANAIGGGGLAEFREGYVIVKLTFNPGNTNSELDYAFSDGTDIYFNSLSLASGTNKTVSPAVQTSTFSQPSITITADKSVTVSPGVQTITTSQPTPSYLLDWTTSPGVQTSTFTAISPTITLATNKTVSPDAQTSTLSQPTPTTSYGYTTSPNVQTGTFTPLSPTVTVATSITTNPNVQTLTSSPISPSFIYDYTTSPNVQSATFGQQSITITVGDGATPAVQTASLSQANPTITAVKNTTVSEEVNTATFTAVSPTIQAQTPVTVSPSVQTLTATNISPSLNYDYTTSQGVQTATLSLQAPSISIQESNALAVQTATFSQPTPALNYDYATSPNTQTATFTTPAASVQAGGAVVVSPAVQTITSSQPTPAYNFDYTTSPNAQTSTFTTQSPTIQASGATTVSPSSQTATLSTQNATITAIQNTSVSAGVNTTTSSVPSATVTAVKNVSVSPTTNTATFNLNNPSVTVGEGLSMGVQTVTLSQPAPTLNYDYQVSAGVQTATFTTPNPSVDLVTDKVVSPGVQTINSSQPTTTVNYDCTVSLPCLTIGPAAIVYNEQMRPLYRIAKDLYLTL